jgi:hypothetical protein
MRNADYHNIERLASRVPYCRDSFSEITSTVPAGATTGKIQVAFF